VSSFKHIFFDLDHTLWDFERNSRECLVEIFNEFRLDNLGIETAETFTGTFLTINYQLWNLLDTRVITHEELRRRRFGEALAQLGATVSEDRSLEMNEFFLQALPSKQHLIPGGKEILDYLSPNYALHIISNGFHEVQLRKMKSSGIHDYFREIVTNEVANARKPEKAIFDFALNAAGAATDNSIMIGDNIEADVNGALNAGLACVYFNPDSNPSPYESHLEVKSLDELREIL